MVGYTVLVEDRNELHKNHESQRVLSEKHNEVGMAGEFSFGEFCGLWPDTESKPGGDGGIDFTVPLKFTVDVKTARKPGNLIHEQGKPVADIYVLAGYDDQSEKATLLGWQWGATLAAAPVRDFGYGVINHYIPQSQLRPMSELQARL